MRSRPPISASTRRLQNRQADLSQTLDRLTGQGRRCRPRHAWLFGEPRRLGHRCREPRACRRRAGLARRRGALAPDARPSSSGCRARPTATPTGSGGAAARSSPTCRARCPSRSARCHRASRRRRRRCASVPAARLTDLEEEQARLREQLERPARGHARQRRGHAPVAAGAAQGAGAALLPVFARSLAPGYLGAAAAAVECRRIPIDLARADLRHQSPSPRS